MAVFRDAPQPGAIRIGDCGLGGWECANAIARHRDACELTVRAELVLEMVGVWRRHEPICAARRRPRQHASPALQRGVGKRSVQSADDIDGVQGGEQVGRKLELIGHRCPL